MRAQIGNRGDVGEWAEDDAKAGDVSVRIHADGFAAMI